VLLDVTSKMAGDVPQLWHGFMTSIKWLLERRKQWKKKNML